MNIQQLDKKRILISLCSQDMEQCGITFESLSLSDPHSENILRRLLIKAALSTGVSLKDKHITIEALKHDLGCMLLLTLSDKKRHGRIFKVNRARDVLTFSFGNVESFLRCAVALNRLNEKMTASSAFCCGGKYYLVISSPLAIKSRVVNTAMEFALRKIGGKAFAAHLNEHGSALSVGHAVETIGSKYQY